ncbi:phosphoribosylglycinamide formyltransferase [Scrofimicrobium sp. R131]|uniref:Phosphoribosylglycinamide formyltransferase n=1 Tax=Scrofimicrobium appendicitidis TaxID=3079930 RepID=A0AAU7V8Q6_9ACTO
MSSLAVFASGTGSNFVALADALDVSVLVCDRPEAAVIARAGERGIPVVSVSPRFFPDKAAYEAALLRCLEHYRIDFVALAGYMRLVGPTLLGAYGGRIVNIHPSLLPAFPGAHAISEAHAARVSETGVTIHFIDEGIDTGPVIAQQAIAIDPAWTLDQLEEQIHRVEHKLYPQVLAGLVGN